MSATPEHIALYDRQRVIALLRNWTPQRLLQELEAGQFDLRLSADERSELAALLDDWTRRALGLVTLRDALLVDRQRGTRVHDLLCQALTVEHRVPPDDDLDRVQQQAEAQGLALACYTGLVPHYSLPSNLEELLPVLPAPYQQPALRFEQPTGLRRILAIALAVLGMGALGLPLLLGQVPAQSAGLPLGLLTLALMVGIRADWPGYIGAFCIWLVPNLPEFHYGTTFPAFLHAVPLLLVGFGLLASDRYVRALWCWIWGRMYRRE